MSTFFNYLFPVKIIRLDDVLIIEDRRPTAALFVSGLVGILTLGFIIPATVELISLGFLWVVLVFGGMGIFLIGYCLTRTFREIYVFDRAKDTYTFTRQSAFKKDVIEGALSRFRAVQVQRKEVSGESGTQEIYHVALLEQGGLLFGSSGTQLLREDPPIFNSFEAESRIAGAITSFLSVRRDAEVIDV